MIVTDHSTLNGEKKLNYHERSLNSHMVKSLLLDSNVYLHLIHVCLHIVPRVPYSKYKINHENYRIIPIIFILTEMHKIMFKEPILYLFKDGR